MIDVVAALIWDGDRFLACQRPANKTRALLWEFVGGKTEPGETPEEAISNADDCRREWIAAALEEGIQIPEPVPEGEYSGQFKLRIPKSLHKSLAEHSRAEGLSMNQYCLYLLAKNDASYRQNSKHTVPPNRRGDFPFALTERRRM